LRRRRATSDLVPGDDSRIVGAIRIDDQSASERAEINQIMPIPPVARQARRLDAVDRADIARAQHCDKPLEAETLHRAGPRAIEIIVDYCDGCEAGCLGRIREIILPPMAFEVAGDLRHRRLTNVYDRGATDVVRRDLGFIDASQLRLGTSASSERSAKASTSPFVFVSTIVVGI
jgi:hypothetical protein